MITGNQLKNMSSIEFTKACSIFPMEIRLKLAVLAGSGDKGMSVYEGKDMSNGVFYHETLDYEALAELLNQEVKQNVS